MSIYESITKAMSQIAPIAKAQKNQMQGFMFRGIDAIMNELQPVFIKNKIFVSPEVLETKREDRQTAKGGNLIYSVLKIKFTFYAEDGSNVSATVIGEAMDSGDKASNKALSIGFKYACLQVFCIPTEDTKDPDFESHEIKPLDKPETKPSVKSKAPDPKMLELANIMKKLKPDGTPYFTDAQKAGYKKKIEVLGLEETLRDATIALEEMESVVLQENV